MDEKDSIEKIDEQIDALLHPSEDVEELSTVEEEGDTKKIKTVEDIKEIENSTISQEDTKRIPEVRKSENSNVEEAERHSVSEDKMSEKEDIPKGNDLNENNKNNKNNKKKKILIIIGILFLFILVLVLFFLFHREEEDISQDKEDTFSKSEQKEIITGYGDALQGVLAVYYDKQKVLLEYDDAVKLVEFDYNVQCSEHEIYEDGSIYLNQCSIDEIDTKYSYGEKQEKKEEPQVSSDAIKVYVHKSSQYITLKEPKTIEDYDVFSFQIDGEYSELTLFNEKNTSYVFYADSRYNAHVINFKTGREVLDMLNYTSILPIKVGDVFDSDYVAVEMNGKWGIYNLNSNERVVPHQYDYITPVLFMGISGPSLYISALEDGIIAVANHGAKEFSSEFGVIDYRSGKEIIPLDYSSMLKSGKYLWTRDFYGNGHIFDYYGVEYLNDLYDEIYWIVDGKYILVKEKDNIKLVSIKGKEIYDYGKLELGPINYGLSYNDGALFQFNQKGENSSSVCVEIIYNSSKKTGEVKDSSCGGIAKPILYLYPQKTTNVKVTFEHPEYLETTYPKYQKSWNVTAHKNGDLYDSKGHYYYGLYWDEMRVHPVDFSTGFYVEKENAVDFLEEKLDKIGFSPREANEFIMYWLPILEKNEKSLVYFELTEERESYQKIHITPKPDSLLRVVIHVKKVNQKTSISEEKLTTFVRRGFTAVEWGGTTY